MYSSTDLIFRKSSYSGHGDNCVEIADLPTGAAVRDSKRPEAGHLLFSVAEWSAFVQSAVRGDL